MTEDTTRDRILAAMSETEYRHALDIGRAAKVPEERCVPICRALAEVGMVEGRIRRRIEWRRFTHAERVRNEQVLASSPAYPSCEARQTMRKYQT